MSRLFGSGGGYHWPCGSWGGQRSGYDEQWSGRGGITDLSDQAEGVSGLGGVHDGLTEVSVNCGSCHSGPLDQ